MKKIFSPLMIIGAIGLLLILGFLSCATTPKENIAAVNVEVDIWSPVLTPDLLDGDWEGSATLPIAKDSAEGMPETSIPVTVFISCAKAVPDIKLSVKMDFEPFLNDIITTTGQTPSTEMKDTIWPMISAEMTGTGFSVGNYYCVMEQMIPASEFKAEDDFRINQYRTKLKMTLSKDSVPGINDDFEIILNRK